MLTGPCHNAFFGGLDRFRKRTSGQNYRTPPALEMVTLTAGLSKANDRPDDVWQARPLVADRLERFSKSLNRDQVHTTGSPFTIAILDHGHFGIARRSLRHEIVIERRRTLTLRSELQCSEKIHKGDIERQYTFTVGNEITRSLEYVDDLLSDSFG